MQLLHIRTSERRTWKRCPQQWYWSYVENLSSLRKRNPLWFGTAVHSSLAARYIPGSKRGSLDSVLGSGIASLDEVREMIVKSDEEEEVWVDAHALLIDMVTGYVDHYGDEAHIEVLMPEHSFQARLQPKFRGGQHIQYDGTFDLALRDNEAKEVWIGEHKTAASIRLDHLPLDEQNGSYITFAEQILRRDGLIKPKEKVRGVMYNFLRKVMADTRPTNDAGLATNKPQKAHYIDALYNHFGQDSAPEEMEGWEKDLPKMSLVKLDELAKVQGLTVLGEVSKQQPGPRFVRSKQYRSLAQRKRMLARIREEAILLEQMRKGNPLYPIWKNPTMDCSWCEFYNLCHLDEMGDQVEVEAMKMSMFTKRDPYADHRTKSHEE